MENPLKGTRKFGVPSKGEPRLSPIHIIMWPNQRILLQIRLKSPSKTCSRDCRLSGSIFSLLGKNPWKPSGIFSLWKKNAPFSISALFFSIYAKSGSTSAIKLGNPTSRPTCVVDTQHTNRATYNSIEISLIKFVGQISAVHFKSLIWS